MAKFGSRNRRLSTVGAGLGVIALAVGASALGAGVATAETATSGAYTFTRTVDNASPKIGDTITYTTVSTKSGLEGYVNRLTEIHAGCLEFVPGSAKISKLMGGLPGLGGVMKETVETPNASQSTATTKVFTSNGWYNNSKNPITMKTSYVVKCDPGTYGSGLTVGATLLGGGAGTSASFPEMGPAIVVQTTDPTGPGTDPGTDPGTNPGTNPGTGGGAGSLGSLSGGLGSLSGLFGSS